MLVSFRSLLSAGFSLIPGLVLLAQEATRPATDAPAARRDATQGTQLDKYLVKCLKTANQGEIALSKIAQQRATNKDVKAFAEQMVKDHTDFLTKLEKFDSADSGERAAPGTATPRATEREPREQAQPSATRAGSGDVAAQLMQIKQEIAQKCIASAYRELEQKQGAEFDKCFMIMQGMAHQKMVDELTVFKNHASSELQSTLAAGLQTAQGHLDHAKKICKQLEKGAAEDRSGSDRNQ